MQPRLAVAGRSAVRSLRFAALAAMLAPSPAPGAVPPPAHAAHPAPPFFPIGHMRPMAPLGTGRPFSRLGTGRPFGGSHTTPGAGKPAPAPVANPTPPVTLPPPTTLIAAPPAATSGGTGAGAGEEQEAVRGVVVSGVPSPPPVDRQQEASTPSSPVLPDPATVDLVGRLADEADAWFGEGRAAQAEASLEAALGLFPHDAALRFRHALALVGTRNVDGAARELVRAVEIDPDLLEGDVDVIGPFGSRERFDAALAFVERYLAAYPLDSYARFLLAYLRLHTGEGTTAREDVDALLRNDPGFPLASLLRRRRGAWTTSDSVSSSPP